LKQKLELPRRNGSRGGASLHPANMPVRRGGAT